jgi:predicted transcriptional regulator
MMKVSAIIFIMFLGFFLMPVPVAGGYLVQPYTTPTGPYDSGGSDIMVSFFDLPPWIQAAWVISVLLGFLSIIAFGPIILGRIRDVLKNENRRLILQYIGVYPGCKVSDISNDMQINRGTVKYHTYFLCLERKIVRKKDGKMLYLFRNGSVVNERKQFFGYIRNPAKREILMTILNEPGISNTRIAEKMRLDKSTVHWHLSQFQQEQMVDCTWDGRSMNYQVSDEVAEILKNFSA